MTKTKQLKLYIWEDVLCDYTCGVMFALAHNEDEARRLVLKSLRHSDDELDKAMQRIHDAIQSPDDEEIMKRLFYDEKDLLGKPRCITSPEGFYVYGGG